MHSVHMLCSASSWHPWALAHGGSAPNWTSRSVESKVTRWPYVNNTVSILKVEAWGQQFAKSSGPSQLPDESHRQDRTVALCRRVTALEASMVLVVTSEVLRHTGNATFARVL